ncbi:MAG TPA: CotH kinase family protein [Schlesneria sp.]|jgi:hypothetical protein
MRNLAMIISAVVMVAIAVQFSNGFAVSTRSNDEQRLVVEATPASSDVPNRLRTPSRRLSTPDAISAESALEAAIPDGAHTAPVTDTSAQALGAPVGLPQQIAVPATSNSPPIKSTTTDVPAKREPLQIAQKPAVTQKPAAAPKNAEPAPKVVAPEPPKRKPPKVDPTNEFFQKGMIPEIRITLTDKEEQQLRRDLRRYVDVTFTENETTTFKKVKMKLKGSAGSFRDLNDRPALTLSMRKKGEQFHGLDKFHLNNSVQDESYLNELIASQLCLEAGLPAARTSHARVWLNGRDLGFYVLKEGMDEDFIKRHYKYHKGNFYEGGFCTDIDAPLEKEFGDGPDDRTDLKELIAACREGDQTKRWQLIEQKVAIDEFINFVAMELMMCHWDGYCQNKNNYRLYFHEDDKKVCFLPHGMDQMFGDINFGVFHVPGQIVANAVMQNPAVQAKYRQRVRELLPMFAPDKLHAKIDIAHARIRPALASIHEDRARQFDARVQDYKNRVAGRALAIKSQFPPEPIAFNADDWALVEDWAPKPQGDAKLELTELDGKKVLSFTPGPSNQTQASFRTKVRLARGRYHFDAKVKTKDVMATPEDKGFGAGVRLGGGSRKNNVIGTSDWQTVSHEFEITQDLQEIELVTELRSTAGSAQFDLASLRVYKQK